MKTEKIYRFEHDGVGIYEAVEFYCPRDDQRRATKPDGAWPPKVGKSYPGAISFWKAKGISQYTNSGLRNWHFSVVPNQIKLIVCAFPENVLYEDEYQIICLPSEIKEKKTHCLTYCGPRPFKSLEEDNRPNFIRHHQSLRDWASYSYPNDDENFTLVSSVGKDLGLEKVGIHHEILKPGRRSSWPHAHKVEEELVYVIKGRPTLWINGKLFQAQADDAIFFPPGTGLAHSILNQTNEDIELLVLGEQNAEGDLIYYPLHPARNEEVAKEGGQWRDVPKKALGEHSGRAIDLGQRENGPFAHSVSVADLKIKEECIPNEELKTYVLSKDLGRAMGAKRIALHHQVLPSGYRLGVPHAESDEEEFVYVLSGNLMAWIDGKRVPLQEGDSVAFPSGTGIAHTFINESGKDVELLVAGETTKENNKCSFPLNPEFAEKYPSIWWENPPQRLMGEDSSLPLRGKLIL